MRTATVLPHRILCAVLIQCTLHCGTSVYKSTIGGGSWVSVGSFSSKAISMDGSATSTDTVYIGTVPVTSGPVAAIYKTTNGSSFQDVSSGQIPNRLPTDIHVNPNNSKEVYVTFGGFGSGHIYKTTNGGASWTNISGNLPDIPHQSVCIDPQYPQNVYVGNDLGVYVTTNGELTGTDLQPGCRMLWCLT